MRHALWTLGLLVLGCADGEPDTDDPGSGRCGAVTEHELTLVIAVVDGAEAPVEGATVRLEERAWSPGTVGEGTTDAAGQVTLADLSLTGVEDCWGTALDYVVVATDGARTVEDGLNPSLFNAVSTGQDTLDRTDRPLVLE